MKTGTKIIVTNSPYNPNLPNGSIMTVTMFRDDGDVEATVDNGDGFNWFMDAGSFKEYTAPTKETGTLKELNVKPGDVVEWRGREFTAFQKPRPAHADDIWAGTARADGGDGFLNEYSVVTIVSRADLPHGHVTLPDGRTMDLSANRVRCDLMEPDELQAMKDHGGPYEYWSDNWVCIIPSWLNCATYRVAPKPVVETVVLCYRRDSGMVKNRIGTINLIDGKPDMASIIDTKTEEL